MIKDLYNTNILKLSSDIPRLGKLDQPDSSSTVVSKLCGSKITVYLNMDNDVVSDFTHEIKACSLGKAASSVMARNIIGSDSKELLEIKQEEMLLGYTTKVSQAFSMYEQQNLLIELYDKQIIDME